MQVKEESQLLNKIHEGVLIVTDKNRRQGEERDEDDEDPDSRYKIEFLNGSASKVFDTAD